MNRVLFLPFPPSVNSYWRHILMPKKGKVPTTGDVRAIISAKGRDYRLQVAKAVTAHGICDRMLGPIAVHVWACPPDRRRRDLDNLPKAIFDACTHAGVWGDDSQIQRLTIQWCQGTAKSETAQATYELQPGLVVLEIRP